MSIFSGPEIANNGLVFSYDMSNTQKSWEGAPTTNLHPISGYITWPTQTLHFWEGNSWVVDSTYTNPGVPGPAGTYLGIVRKYTSGALSATWSGNSYAYVLKTAPMTAGQSYAMSAYTYLSSDCNIDGMHSSIEGATVSALSGGYVTSYNMSQKGSWQRQGLQGTASGNVNFIIAYPNKVGVTNGVFTGSILVGGAQVEFGTFPTPYTDNSRSTTQAILDLTGLNTVTATSLTYNSDGTVSFNGSSNYLTVPTSSSLDITSAITLAAWIKPTTSAGFPGIIAKGYATSGGYSLQLRTDNSLWFELDTAASARSYYNPSSTLVSLNVWSYVVATYDGTTMNIYINGQKVGSGFAQSITIGVISTAVTIGQLPGYGYLNGHISAAQIYNRGLSAVEVFQNFEALRGRYNI